MSQNKQFKLTKRRHITFTAQYLNSSFIGVIIQICPAKENIAPEYFCEKQNNRNDKEK